MYYVYILQSKEDGSYYTGYTEDLDKRITEHNQGKSAYTSTKIPYTVTWYSVFTDKMKALNFERYLKSSSGTAFRNKHLI